MYINGDHTCVRDAIHSSIVEVASGFDDDGTHTNNTINRTTERAAKQQPKRIYTLCAHTDQANRIEIKYQKQKLKWTKARRRQWGKEKAIYEAVSWFVVHRSLFQFKMIFMTLEFLSSHMHAGDRHTVRVSVCARTSSNQAARLYKQRASRAFTYIHSFMSTDW